MIDAELLEGICRVLVTPRPDCMLWPTPEHKGYGRISIDGGPRLRIHRVIWEAANGPIPADMVIDHLCRVRSCCNTAHMELVSPEENTQRSRGFPRIPQALRKSTPPRPQSASCRNGHPYVEGSFSVNSDGSRRCRICRRAAEKKRYRSART